MAKAAATRPVKAAAKKAAAKAPPNKTKTAAKRARGFVWYECMAKDMKAAEKFYQSVIGWSGARSDTPNTPYTIVSAGETGVGGIMPMPDEIAKMGVQPHWIGYIGVDDTDAYCKKVASAGGTIHRPAADIPGVGRFAVVADPHGAPFVLFTPNTLAEPKPVAANTPGHAGWHELAGNSVEESFGFYAKLFGWTKGEAMDMGPMGVYQMFDVNGVTVGGMMKRAPEMPHAFWLYYFNVPALDAAVSRVTKGKGKIVRPAMEVPGGLWIAVAQDPQGAHFAMVAPKR